MRRAVTLFIRVLAPQPTGDLPRRPLQAQLARNQSAQRFVERKLTGFWAGSFSPKHAYLNPPRYRPRPPFRPTCRLMVQGARARSRAIARKDRSAASPREISSRSLNVRAIRDLMRFGGLIPPVRARWEKSTRGRDRNSAQSNSATPHAATDSTSPTFACRCRTSAWDTS